MVQRRKHLVLDHENVVLESVRKGFGELILDVGTSRNNG